MKHLTRALAAGFVSVIVILTAGCTVTTASPTAGPPVIDQGTSPAESRLTGKLLAESDLPTGFSETLLPTVQGGFGSLIGCPGLSAPPASDADEARVSFAGGAAGNLISESVRLAGPADSRKVLADLAAAPQQCQGFVTTTAPKLGSEASAIELNATLAGVGTVVNGYIIGMRDDQIVVVVVFVSPGKADRTTADTVTRIAWEKAALGVKPSPTIGS